MKKIFGYALLSLFFFSPVVFADVPPPDSHPLNRCIKIVNLDQYPNVVLIGYYTGPMVKTYEAYQIKHDKCLEKGYKFNTLNIYWTTKEKFNSTDLKNLKLTSKKVPTGGSDGTGKPTYTERFFPIDLTLLLENVEPYGGYVNQSNPMIKEDIEYSITGSADTKLILYKTKQISEYNNGTPKKIEAYTNPQKNKITPPVPTSTAKITPKHQNAVIGPTAPKRGFGASIMCFLRSLFGKSCQ